MIITSVGQDFFRSKHVLKVKRLWCRANATSIQHRSQNVNRPVRTRWMDQHGPNISSNEVECSQKRSGLSERKLSPGARTTARDLGFFRLAKDSFSHQFTFASHILIHRITSHLRNVEMSFEPKQKVELDPPKDDPISLEYLAKCDGWFCSCDNLVGQDIDSSNRIQS